MQHFSHGRTAPKITIVTTMKYEGPYILDWLAHYRTLGVQDFLVFTNDCSDPTDHILRILNQKGIVQHRFNRVMRRGPHKSALMWARYEPVVMNSDWIFVADVDEYLHIHSGNGTLTGLLAEHDTADAISFVWRIFGNAGVTRLTGEPVPRQFCNAQSFLGGEKDRRYFKTIYRNCDKFARLGVHRPFLSDDAADIRWILPDGTPFSDAQIQKGLTLKGHFGYEAAQLNHYALRSVDGFLNKKARGRANHHLDTIEEDYWKKFDKNDEVDTGLAERFAVAEAIKDTWLEDDELRAYHEEALEMHQRRARRARRKEEVQSLLAKITPPSDTAVAAE